MVILRTDIERALNELSSQEEGMRFQGLAVVLGKKRWPELIARQRKKDFGLDAYAPASLTPEKIGKGLAASITPTLKKISDDAKTAKTHFPDLGALLFVTSAKIGNADRKRWEETIHSDYGVELYVIEREEIITLMILPENASLRASFLHLEIEVEPQIADLIDRTRRAVEVVARTWAAKTKGYPLIELTANRLAPDGAESAEVLSLEQIDQALSQSGRIVLEGPAGRGKTTTLIQLGQRTRSTGLPFIVELPAWTSSRRGILEYIAGMPAFQAEGITAADLARVQQAEPFLFLLNGWNEIADSKSELANDALREIERDFPSAGIIVATRTHHLTPPLPGATRLRLLRLRREQRAAYLAARLGAQSAELCAHIEIDPSLDELTRTPFILSEVASLFEAGATIPSTKIGVISQVLRLHEQRDEHRNALQTGPIFGRQTDYLKALATEMTRSGSVTSSETDARAVSAVVARELRDRGQIELVGPPAVLATLTAHHVLERVDYPQTAFLFEHQQLQEYYAALDVRAQLLDLQDDDHQATARFSASYVNDPAWAEPLRMIAETFAEQTGDREIDRRNTSAGRKLVAMALAVDLVFAGELARHCGATVWSEVRAAFGERIRAVYAIRDGSFRQYAVAAMLAVGGADFGDIIVPLLSGQDQQTRLRTYRLWPDIQVSSLGPNWREQVLGWSEEARADFVAELLHHRVDGEVAAFAAEDDSTAVKNAAVSSLMWTRSDSALIPILESMDTQAFEDVARWNADQLPAALRPRTLAAIRHFIEISTDHPARLQAALLLVEFGEKGLDRVVKDAMVALSGRDMRNLGSHHITPALEYLRRVDPAWASDWVANQVAEGNLYEHEYWLSFATAIPDDLVEKCLQRTEAENLKNEYFGGMISIIAARADANLAARVFATLRELRRRVDAESDARHELEWQKIRQMETVFRALPHDIAAAGILSSVTNGDPLDVKVAAGLLSRVARPDVEPLRIADKDLKAHLRAYLKSGVDVILHQDDFNGQEKANLASSIAQVGRSEDMSDLLTLTRSDIERMRRGRAARAAGDRGPLGNGGTISYARWHIAAVMHLDATAAEQVLIDLLPEPEYLSSAAAAMTRDFVPTSERASNWTLRHDVIWASREGLTPPYSDNRRRTRFAVALNDELKRLQALNQDGKFDGDRKELAKALAAIDGRSSAGAVLSVIAIPGEWDQYSCLDAAERLLMAGVALPPAAASTLIHSVVERAKKSHQESDRYLLRRVLSLCPFVTPPAEGIATMRDVLSEYPLPGYELREVITALGQSRSDAAVDFLCELASDDSVREQCEDIFCNAFAALDTPRAHELLLGSVDPDVRQISLARGPHREHLLVARIAELAQRRPNVAERLGELCKRDLPEHNRQLLSRVMARLGTPEAFALNLNLINDAKPSPVPQGIWDQLESAFVEHRPEVESPNVFTQHARTSNDLRVLLFKMAFGDEKRRQSALMLLGQLEEWRLEYGRPMGEPRHPDLASGLPWPPRVS
ncbi:hypothetical protein D3C86_758580 [compost metagenome]